MSNETIGIITEVGDLGLGFEPISESDQAKLEEEKNRKEEK